MYHALMFFPLLVINYSTKYATCVYSIPDLSLSCVLLTHAVAFQALSFVISNDPPQKDGENPFTWELFDRLRDSREKQEHGSSFE